MRIWLEIQAIPSCQPVINKRQIAENRKAPDKGAFLYRDWGFCVLN